MPHIGAFDFLAERGIVFSSLRHRLNSIKKSNAGLRPCHFFLLSLWDYFMIPFRGSYILRSKPMRLRRRFFCSPNSQKQASLVRKTKNPRKFVGFDLVWRRERDSNPRTCDSQRFSRPPHSTALPSLRGKSKTSKLIYEIILKKTSKNLEFALVPLQHA